jgi:O-antigen ligase
LFYSGQHLEWLGPFPRLLGGYHNVHIASHLMILFAVTGLFQFRVATHSWHKLLLFLFIAGALFFHINTFVRTTTVGLLVYLATLLYVQRRIDILFTLIIVVFAVYTQSEFVGERFGEIETLLTQDRTLEQDSMGSGRVGFYRRGIVEFLSRPLFNIIFGLGLAESMDLGKYQHDIHSDYLFLLFSMGPGGLLLYLWMQVRVVLGAVWVRKFSSDVWERKFAEHVVALNALVMLVNAISNSYVTRLTAGWIFWGTCGILLATETDLRVRLAKAAAATKEIVKGAPAIAGNWDPAFAPSIGKRNIDVTRGERPGLGRHWKPLNPPKSSGKE